MHRHPTPRHEQRPDGTQPSVTVTLLGSFRVTVDGTTTAARGWSRKTAATLVKVLALAPGHRLHREQVLDILWPDEPTERSAPRLHKAAHFARRAAGRDDAIVLRDDVVWLFPGVDITVDAVRFEQLARAAVAEGDEDAAREALSWYRGELLPSDRYEEWALDRRELLHLRRLDVLRVAGEWRELAELDPTNEEAHTELMRRHLEAGATSAALRQYEHLERVLDRELGVEPEKAAASLKVDALLAELAELVHREAAVLAELAAAGAEPPALHSMEP